MPPREHIPNGEWMQNYHLGNSRCRYSFCAGKARWSSAICTDGWEYQAKMIRAVEVWNRKRTMIVGDGIPADHPLYIEPARIEPGRTLSYNIKIEIWDNHDEGHYKHLYGMYACVDASRSRKGEFISGTFAVEEGRGMANAAAAIPSACELEGVKPAFPATCWRAPERRVWWPLFRGLTDAVRIRRNKILQMPCLISLEIARKSNSSIWVISLRRPPHLPAIYITIYFQDCRMRSQASCVIFIRNIGHRLL